MAAPTTNSRTKKVLVLHGRVLSSVHISCALRKESKNIDFVFINAPHILLPSELMGSPARFDSAAPSETPTAEETQADPDLALRGWWKSNKERTEATGLEESIMSVREVLRAQRFDGVFGLGMRFRQGAAFAALLSALVTRTTNVYPPFLVDGAAPHPPLFPFCVSVSGFKLRDPFCDPIFAAPHYTTPTLHVIGRTDVVVVEERSRQLVDMSGAARVEEHEGGHFVPSKGQWRKFLVNYMLDPTAPLASPSGGAATPTAA
ncbi:serine hydrolase FSH, partial [Flammula alnicola]